MPDILISHPPTQPPTHPTFLYHLSTRRDLVMVLTHAVLHTTHTGKPRESTSRTTVFKRALDKSYHLKLKASR